MRRGELVDGERPAVGEGHLAPH